MISHSTPTEHTESKYLTFFGIGFLIYQLSGIFTVSQNISFKTSQLVQILGLALMGFGAIKILHFRIKNNYLRITLFLYYTWLLTLAIRGVPFLLSYDYLKEFFFSDAGNGGLFYLVPLVILFPRNPVFFKKLFDFLILCGVLYLLFSAIFIQKLLVHGSNLISQGLAEFISPLSIPIAFLLLTFKYHARKRIIFSIIIIIITLCFVVIRARRGLIFITSCLVIASYLVYFFNSKKNIFLIYIPLLLLSLGALYASGIYHPNQNKLFGFLAERGVEDSRTGVELYFYDDMTDNNWLIGKGLRGEYYCPGIEEGQITDYRNSMETGYLQMILKGGVISLGLLLIIVIPAFIKGIFFSKNLLTKAAGIWIFIFMISLYIQSAASFNLSYILVWVSVGICYSDEIRKMPDKEISKWLFNN